MTGVNLAGAEFGADAIPGLPGVDYTFNGESTFRYFGERGFAFARIPFRWERMQPRLRGPLDADYPARLRENVEWAAKYGMRAIVEPHNFGRYSIGGREYVIDNAYQGAVRVSTLDLVDFWERMSEAFRDADALHAYGLMNEPHDMGSADWGAISQAVLSAIRNRGDGKLILVPGDDWSSANRWTRDPSWIADPAGNFAYEAHQYFDRDESGRYVWSYDEELARDPLLARVGRRRVRGFLNWCAENGVRGFIGEYGVPNDDARWQAVVEDFLAALDEAGVDACWWAAGEWWGDYRLSIQPVRDGQDSELVGRASARAGLPSRIRGAGRKPGAG